VPDVEACALARATCALAWATPRLLAMGDRQPNLENRTMMTLRNRWAALAVLGGAALAAVTAPALADVKDFEFQLVQSEVKKGNGAIVAVRLVNKKTGKAVPDAVFAAKRIDMAPDAMAEMAASLELMPATEPGVYRFKTNLSMEGRWQLSLGAKVQGETGTIQSKLVLKAVP
jgi:hypothetical protein